MSRFISWLAVGIAAAFLVVVSVSFSSATTAWLAFAIGVGTLVTSAGVAYRYRGDVAPLLLGLVSAAISAWTVVASLVFSQTTVQTLALASALALSGLAVAGLTAHEVEHDYTLSPQQREEVSRGSESRLAPRRLANNGAGAGRQLGALRHASSNTRGTGEPSR